MRNQSLDFNIATAGLTAAGKTTHGLQLAAALNFEYVCATDLFLRHMGRGGEESQGIWFSELDQIEVARQGDHLDAAVEAELIEMAQTRSGVVFDTWALPWLCDSTSMIRLWIDSDAPSRSRKAYVSQIDAGLSQKRTVEECLEHIQRKDGLTRDRFMRRHRFDLYKDRTPFQVVLDNSSLIPAADVASARRGIREFESVVLHAVLAAAGVNFDANRAALTLLDPDDIYLREIRTAL